MSDDDDERALDGLPRWPLTYRGLYPRERWRFFNDLWADACMLRARYRLPLRSGWWESDVQIEALAALAAATHRFDSGAWDDPLAKIAFLGDLERVVALLRNEADPFHPDRDRTAFVHYVVHEIGAELPPATS